MKFKILSLLLLSFLLFNQLNAQAVKEIDSKQVNTLLQKNKKIVVLDVRTEGEFKEGHIKGAKNINILEADAFDKIKKLDRNATYIVYCRTRNRSLTAVDHMVQSGFKNIYQMTDGYSGWKANQLPLEK